MLNSFQHLCSTDSKAMLRMTGCCGFDRLNHRVIQYLLSPAWSPEVPERSGGMRVSKGRNTG